MNAKIASITALLSLIGCNESDERLDSLKKKWEGAVIVKICISGKHIWRLSNGELVNKWGDRVESLEVCQ
jgi:hypothetical protein